MKYQQLKYIYFMPCKPGSIYINITDKCLNDCLFCIKKDGHFFYGSDLSLHGNHPKPSDIINELYSFQFIDSIREIVFCGMGEPLLRYECVVDICKAIRRLNKQHLKIRVDTSGLFWHNNNRLDILDWIDILSISLNAENAEKYEELCNPKIANAYAVLMGFLRTLKDTESNYIKVGKSFPKVCLSVVDTSEEEFIPESGRKKYEQGKFPIPDFEKCQQIAAGFGWPLIIKKLFRDSKDEIWNDESTRKLCASGISLDICKDCSNRH